MPKEKRKKEKEKRKRISERRSDVGDLLAVLEVDALEMRTVLGQFDHPYVGDRRQETGDRRQKTGEMRDER